MAEARWTAKQVADRMDEAADTLRRLPPAITKPRLCSWPAIVRDASDAYGWEPERLRLGPPSAAAIDRMDEALVWLAWLDADDARLVWARASGVRWKLIGYRFGIGRNTAWRRWVVALTVIATALNGGTKRSRASALARAIRPPHAQPSNDRAILSPG